MWLGKLVGATRERVEAGYYDRRPEILPGSPTSLREAVERASPALLAEIKPGRPGQAPQVVDVAERARAYARAGACAISVLTDSDHFGGSLENLALAAQAGRPVLMKDFLIDPRQVDAASAWGASAVLAIARLHTEGYTDHTLTALIEHAHARGLEVLAEAVTEAELDLCLEAGADLVGINVRDLDTLELDEERPARLLSGRALAVPALRLSGIEDARGVREAVNKGADGVLVGGHLMASDDPEAAVRALLEAPR